ncbi:MAG: FAD binding domain-containing protein, partial [Desulfobulbia bacterium]
MYKFNYHRCSSLSDARSQFSTFDEPRYIAGGLTLIPVLNLRLDRPSDLLDIGQLKELNGIEDEGEIISIGAITSHSEVANSSVVQTKIPSLAKLVGGIGDPLVRNRGTIGGSLANNDPSADYPCAVLGLGATVHTDSRTISADAYFEGAFTTALEEGEIITKVSFPVPKLAGYGRIAQPASRFPLIGVFVAKTPNGPRVAVTGAGPGVFRVVEMEKALTANWSADAIKDISLDS